MSNQTKIIILCLTAFILILASAKFLPQMIWGNNNTQTISAVGAGEIGETSSAKSSLDPNWWLASGALFYPDGRNGKSIQGELAPDNYWRTLYNQNNPVDTDLGFHPQNIFRLVDKNQSLNYKETAYFKVNKYYDSASPNRNASNGLFFFNRYIDQNNLYYTGLRVDGDAVIKKKIGGEYFTLAEVKALPGVYDQISNTCLLPINQPIGLRSEVTTVGKTVLIDFYIDLSANGNWQKVLTGTDDGTLSKPFFEAGSTGIRTDFMDFEFRSYQIVNL